MAVEGRERIVRQVKERNTKAGVKATSFVSARPITIKYLMGKQRKRVQSWFTMKSLSRGRDAKSKLSRADKPQKSISYHATHLK